MFNAAEILTNADLPNNVVTRSLMTAAYHTIVTVLKVVFIACYTLTPKSKKDAFAEKFIARLNKIAA